MKRFSALALPALATALGCAGPAGEPPPAKESALAPSDLVDEALDSGRAYGLLRELVTVAPHRLSGSPGAARAVDWARRTMESIGLQNVRLQKVTVPCWVRGDVERVQIVSPVTEDLPALALGGSIATPRGGVTGEILMVRTPMELEHLRERAKGKVIFFNRPMPRALANTFRAYGAAVPQRTNGASLTASVGGVAALVRSMTTRIDDYPHTGALRYDDDVPPVPAAAISTKAAERIAKLLRSGERVQVKIELSCENRDPAQSANVIGEIPGREKPDEIVLIGGHLDAWDVGHGAHDDGAGIVHCLEAARLLLARGLRPKRTIRVVCFMNEENGLAGGLRYLEECGKEKHVAAIESDRGGFEPKGFNTTARGALRERYTRLLAPLAELGMGTLLPGGGGADIAPLRQNGVPLFGLLPAWHRYFDYHHCDRDRIEAVHPRELQLGAVAVACLAFYLADE